MSVTYKGRCKYRELFHKFQLFLVKKGDKRNKYQLVGIKEHHISCILILFV